MTNKNVRAWILEANLKCYPSAIADCQGIVQLFIYVYNLQHMGKETFPTSLDSFGSSPPLTSRHLWGLISSSSIFIYAVKSSHRPPGDNQT